MKKFDPIPLIQNGGHQPYASYNGQIQGPTLLAMLKGATASGFNPMDARRQMQAGTGHPTVLGLLAGGTWHPTPDQQDRDREGFEGRVRGWQSKDEEQRAQKRARNRRLPAQVPWPPSYRA